MKSREKDALIISIEEGRLILRFELDYLVDEIMDDDFQAGNLYPTFQRKKRRKKLSTLKN